MGKWEEGDLVACRITTTGAGTTGRLTAATRICRCLRRHEGLLAKLNGKVARIKGKVGDVEYHRDYFSGGGAD